MNDRLNKKENDSVRDLDNRKMSGADKGRIKVSVVIKDYINILQLLYQPF